MSLINCKAELKLKWTKCCVLTAAGADNVDSNSNNIIFTIKDIKLCLSVLTLSVKDNQKLLKLLSKVFERSVYWNEFKTKSENKNTINEYRYFLKSNIVEFNRLFVLVFTNQDVNSKISKTRRYYSLKGIIKIYNVIINGKHFFDQAVASDIKRSKEIRKLTTGKGQDYTTACLLDYDYIKNHYRLIIIDLSRQKELDADPIAIQQIEFVGQL